MRLELQQRGLLELVKGRGATSEDAYLRRVAESRGLAMVRDIAVWWRALQISGQCRFSSRLLKRMGCFDSLVASYFNGNPTSPFIEELSRGFLQSLSSHEDRLVRAVSQFERALLDARTDDVRTHEIVWDRHPELVFLALENGCALPRPEQGVAYRMLVARHLPGLIACTRDRNAV